jgi:hypothetical protein
MLAHMYDVQFDCETSPNVALDPLRIESQIPSSVSIVAPIVNCQT